MIYDDPNAWANWPGWRFDAVIMLPGISSKGKKKQERMLERRRVALEKSYGCPVRLEPVGKDEEFRVFVQRGEL